MKSALNELRIPSLPIPEDGHEDTYADPEIPALEMRVNQCTGNPPGEVP